MLANQAMIIFFSDANEDVNLFWTFFKNAHIGIQKMCIVITKVDFHIKIGSEELVSSLHTKIFFIVIADLAKEEQGIEKVDKNL